MKTVSGVGYSELGVASVDVVTGELCAVAKIFAIRSTISAIPIGPSEPWNADTITH